MNKDEYILLILLCGKLIQETADADDTQTKTSGTQEVVLTTSKYP